MPRRQAYTRVHSACPHDCPSTCALEVERIDSRTIGRVYGAQDNDYTAGTICAKVARYAERVHHPDRLTQPLRRTGPKGVGLASFTPISWDEALDEVAQSFLHAAQEHGPQSIWPYHFAGTMGLLQRDGIFRLRHVMGYSRQHSTICTALVDAGWEAGTGIKRGVDPREIGQSDLVVMWGGNPVNTQVNVMTHIAKARRERGAKLVVIDPYKTGTAEKADLHLMVRPGTDAALACAVMHVLFAEGYADRGYLAKFTDAPAELEEHVRLRGPQWASTITGVSAEDIVTFARLYGSTQRSFIRIGYGFARSRNGAVSVHAASCLPAVTGAWQHLGGGALYSNVALYGVDQSVIMGLDAVDESVRTLDQSRIGAILCGNPADLAGGPPVKGLFIQNTNPVMVAPDTTEVRKGFSRSDLFTCVHEQFMTETAAMADIVLPATTFLEHNDIYRGGGHTYLHITKPVIEPLGECRSNHQVLCALGERLGADHPGFRMNEWEIIDDALQRSGYPDADTAYEQRSIDCVADFDTMHYLNGFAHPDGKFHFKPDWPNLGPHGAHLPTLPDYIPITDQATEARPFRMVTAPARGYLNSSFTETPTSQRLEKRPTVLIHPQDCERLTLTDGARTRIGNEQGSVVVHAKIFDGLQPGVVVVESLWPSAAFEEGAGINTLVSADAGAPNGGAVFHDTAVWLRPA
ncbi:MAG: molybdopterin oxidoreductase family protein [Chromatiales bacterium]|jgi:anaerobic selenocysteine-containing dehydrogenase|nr:molybdopterin oxidoreductase family protein [Chromatiales bacterium]